jgi:hypothetical protein
MQTALMSARRRDLLAQLEAHEPVRGDRVVADQRAQDVAGARARAVAVA